MSDLSCVSNDWMSLLSPSRANRTIPEPCRSFLTRCFRLSFQQPSGLYLSVAAPSLPSRSSARRMILAHVRSCMCIKRSDVTALTFTSEQDDSRALSLTDFLMFLPGLPPACRAILERCRSVFAFAFARSQDDTCAISIFLLSIVQLDATVLAVTSEQDDSRALSLINFLMFLPGLPPACRAILECCRSVFVFAFASAQDDTCACLIYFMSIE